MSSNASGTRIFRPLGEVMEMYDSLPEDLRSLVGSSPVPVDLEVIVLLGQKFGPNARKQIERVFDNDFPGWRDPGYVSRYRAKRKR